MNFLDELEDVWDELQFGADVFDALGWRCVEHCLNHGFSRILQMTRILVCSVYIAGLVV